jgi:hypothetical protein
VSGNPAIVLDRDLLLKNAVDNQNGVAYSIIQQKEIRIFEPPSKNSTTKPSPAC